jgi:fructose-1,6-bisphosphatase/inositol monophosphatase family enzyme
MVANAALPDVSADSAEVLALFRRICADCAGVVRRNADWGWSGRRATQYTVDLAVDAVCVPPLLAAGYAVLSEESGRQGAGDAVVVVDPLDGSTNASLGLPWHATALCLVVDGGVEVSTVANLATGETFEAVRGAGAWRDGDPIRVGAPTVASDAIIAINGRLPTGLAPRQYRAMGSTALDIAAVARGGFDGYVDGDDDAIAVWDYLAAVLILHEAGGVAVDAYGRELVTLDPQARRSPVAASSVDLLAELVAARA